MIATPVAMAPAGSHGTASSPSAPSSRLIARIRPAMTARAAMSSGRWATRAQRQPPGGADAGGVDGSDQGRHDPHARSSHQAQPPPGVGQAGDHDPHGRCRERPGGQAPQDLPEDVDLDVRGEGSDDGAGGASRWLLRCATGPSDTGSDGSGDIVITSGYPPRYNRCAAFQPPPHHHEDSSGKRSVHKADPGHLWRGELDPDPGVDPAKTTQKHAVDGEKREMEGDRRGKRTR